MFSGTSSNFNRSLEKATSQLLLEPDWDSVLQIVDFIRQGDVGPKIALQAIKKKIQHENPHVSMFALQVLEACVKNCGSSFHSELATKEFMEFMLDQPKIRADPVKEKILELVQVWSHAFRNEPRLKAVEDTFHLLKMEGHKFPALKEADAMFDAEKAPQWAEGDTCSRCRVHFGVMQRKHHCRNCGEIFCGKCTSKTSIIPKLGFEREVRVCDTCHDKINGQKAGSTSKKEDDLPAEYLASPLSKQTQNPPNKSEQQQQEEEELQLAIALSKSEHETKEKERERLRTNYGVYGGTANDRPSSPAKNTTKQVQIPAIDTSDMDPELARYLNRHYWQQKSDEQDQHPTTVSTTIPSAPTASSEPRVSVGQANEAPQVVSSHLYQNGDTDSQEQFLSALQGSLEIFVNRMRSNSQRGRPIANDSAVQSLFAVISEMHPQLMNHIQEKEEARGYFESLQDKLTQLRDAREALDSLREEHKEKRRREAEELERLRQIQMMQKLEVMRQKKHEYLEMQRQLALQRLQEQEREMAVRLEQQKQLTHMRQMQAYGYPQAYAQPIMGQPGMPPQVVPSNTPGIVSHGYAPQVGSTDGSPVHRMATAGADPYSSLPHSMAPNSMVPPHVSQGQPGMYSMNQPMPGPYAPQATIPQNMMPPGGYHPEGPPQSMMGQPNYGVQSDQGPVSLPPQHSMTGPMTSTPPSMGNYGHMAGQMSTTGAIGQMSTANMPGQITTASTGQAQQQQQQPPMSGMDLQAGFGMPSQPPITDYQSFNMQGLTTALPQQNQAVFNNQPSQPQQSQSFNPQAQQFPQQYMGQYPQGVGQMPPSGMPQQQQPPLQQPNEVQLISFD